MAAEPQDVRLRLRRKLEEMVGVEEADLLMDRPPGGWSTLVTKDWLHLELVSFDQRFQEVDRRLDQFDRRLDQFDRRFEQVDRRFDQIHDSIDQVHGRIDGVQQAINQQTWRLMIAMLTGMSILTAIVSFVAKA